MHQQTASLVIGNAHSHKVVKSYFFPGLYFQVSSEDILLSFIPHSFVEKHDFW